MVKTRSDGGISASTIESRYQLLQRQWGDAGVNAAIEWATKATEQGDEHEQCFLGGIYADSVQGDVDFGRASYWFEKAAKAGSDVQFANLHFRFANKLLRENSKEFNGFATHIFGTVIQPLVAIQRPKKKAELEQILSRSWSLLQFIPIGVARELA
jgi:TPR repeat protein